MANPASACSNRILFQGRQQLQTIIQSTRLSKLYRPFYISKLYPYWYFIHFIYFIEFHYIKNNSLFHFTAIKNILTIIYIAVHLCLCTHTINNLLINTGLNSFTTTGQMWPCRWWSKPKGHLPTSVSCSHVWLHLSVWLRLPGGQWAPPTVGQAAEYGMGGIIQDSQTCQAHQKGSELSYAIILFKNSYGTEEFKSKSRNVQ